MAAGALLLAAATLANLGNLPADTGVSLENVAGVTGIQVFVPKPFGTVDVLRVGRCDAMTLPGVPRALRAI